MRGKTTLLAFTALAAGVLTTPAAAHADQNPSADLRMIYGQPKIAADASGITWRWTLTNNGPGRAGAVVATHRVSAGQKIVAVSNSCQGRTEDIVCRFGTLKPGERRTGWIRTAIPPRATGLRVSAQMSWREDGTPTTDPVGMKGPSGA